MKYVIRGICLEYKCAGKTRRNMDNGLYEKSSIGNQIHFWGEGIPMQFDSREEAEAYIESTILRHDDLDQYFKYSVEEYHD